MAEHDRLGVIRHGESTGSVAAEAAETAGAKVIDIPERGCATAIWASSTC
jgi:2,3-bisphosphoglycerate-dependent phosphoglycerate mutase